VVKPAGRSDREKTGVDWRSLVAEFAAEARENRPPHDRAGRRGEGLDWTIADWHRLIRGEGAYALDLAAPADRPDHGRRGTADLLRSYRCSLRNWNSRPQRLSFGMKRRAAKSRTSLSAMFVPLSGGGEGIAGLQLRECRDLRHDIPGRRMTL